MKKINPILFTAVFFLGAAVFALLREQPKLKERIKNLQVKEAEYAKARQALEFDVATLQDQSQAQKVIIFERTQEVEKFKQLTKNVQTKYVKLQTQIQALTPRQADSVLVTLFPVDSTRNRDILVQVNSGNRAMEMLSISESEKRGLEEIISAQSDVIRYDSLIITKLEEQVKLCDLQNENLESQTLQWKKRVRKLIWQRNLGLAGAVGIAVLAIL